MDRKRRKSLTAALAERLERSQHVFLLGLVVAFAVEIVVDWNATFYEINVLRAQLGSKATHYAAILRISVEDPLKAGDRARIRAIADRVLDDEEVVFVRVAGPEGAVIVDAGDPLGESHPHQLERDAKGLLGDPAGFRRRIADSRHRDWLQAVSDAQAVLLRAVLPRSWIEEPPPRGSAAMLAFQDRLYDERAQVKREDDRVVWALGLVSPAPEAKPAGVVVVALRTASLQAGIRRKILKGLAITLFFIGLIAVQRVSARRAELRLIALRDAVAAAREAIANALPRAVPAAPGIVGGLAFAQAERLGGTVFDFDQGPSGALDVFVALPEGSGVDVGFASLYLREEQRRLRERGGITEPEALVRALAAEYAEAPIHRRIELCALRVDATRGEARGVVAGAALPVVVSMQGSFIEAEVEPFVLEGAPTAGTLLEAPIQRFRVALPPGATLVIHDDGQPPSAPHTLPRAELISRVTDERARPPLELAESLLHASERRGQPLLDDLLVIVLRRDD